MAHQLEMGIVQQVQNILLIFSEIVIDAEDIMAVLEQPFTEMVPEKAGTLGYQYSLCSQEGHIQPFWQ